jgi:hemerythrin-like domain-containing protein
MAPARISGPLRTWYDLHEALATEIEHIADAAHALDPSDAAALAALADRFACFESELRNHSVVEDGIMFPAIRQRGGTVAGVFTDEHHHEQVLVYDVRCALLELDALSDVAARSSLVDALDELRASLHAHLAAEEEDVLPQVQTLFGDADQVTLLRCIIESTPADPRLQPWVAGALTPEHREARLRNMATSLPHDAFVVVLHQIRDGVDPDIWTDIERRLPDLAQLADT